MVKPSAIRRIKIARSYSYQEIARLTDKCEATVRAWAKDGMPVLKSQKPHLIAGSDARRYLEKRFQTEKTKMKPGEVRCFSCKARKMLEPGLAEIVPNNASGWRLQGFCPDCEGMCSVVIAGRDIPQISQKLKLETIDGIHAYAGPSSHT